MSRDDAKHAFDEAILERLGAAVRPNGHRCECFGGPGRVEYQLAPGFPFSRLWRPKGVQG